FIKMGLETQASTMKYTMFIITGVYFMFGFKVSNNRKKSYLFKGALILILLSVGLLLHQQILESINSFIYSDNSGAGRIELWLKGIRISLKNYLFGLGPGAQ